MVDEVCAITCSGLDILFVVDWVGRENSTISLVACWSGDSRIFVRGGSFRAPKFEIPGNGRTVLVDG